MKTKKQKYLFDFVEEGMKLPLPYSKMKTK